MRGRNDPCWCGSGQKYKKCHYPEPAPQSFSDDLKQEYMRKYQIFLKNDEQIAGIRAAGHLAASILDQLCARAKPGVTTNELDALSMELHKKAGARPAPLGYGDPPFPKGICTSINDVICHGIPNDRPLAEGDILNIDVTSILDGYYGDCSRMVIVGGKTTAERQRVVETAYGCLMNALDIVKPGLPLNQIAEAITEHAHTNECSVVHQFVAHGVGCHFHEAPQILHSRNSDTTPLAPGMTFTIEPMINLGVPEAEIDSEDEWTAYTADGKDSAQWEHTILVTEDGYEILTPWNHQ